MVKGQLSAEFVVSILLFLSMLIMLFSSLIRTYLDYAGEYQSENIHVTAERYLKTLIIKQAPDDWVNDPYAAENISLGVNGTINYTFAETFSSMNYPHIRNLLNSKDFNIQINYLPSLSISPDYYQTYPVGDVGMSAEVLDTERNPVNVTVYAVLSSGQEEAMVEEAVYGNGKHFWLFNNTHRGQYDVTIIAFDDIRYGITDFEVSVV